MLLWRGQREASLLQKRDDPEARILKR